ncbi:MAG: glycosyltransferase [Verrucomicrobiota bacterium]
MKLLFISNLFPDAGEPNRGLVNARLLRHLAAWAEIRVLSPRPGLAGWWRGEEQGKALPEDARFAPRYPKVPYIPKIGSRFNDWLYALRLKSSLLAVRKDFSFDVVLCSWLYPDAAAVARLAGDLDFPFVAVAQGSDVHQYLATPSRCRRIISAVSQSATTVARSLELARLLQVAGVEKGKLQVIYNGVETEVFKPGNQTAERESLGLPLKARIILYVGNLLPVKNPRLALESLAKLIKRDQTGDYRLVMVGTGPLEACLKLDAQVLGVAEQVTWAGNQKPEQVAKYLRACDVLCLPSLNEGMPNVLLEAMATGKPVVATNVGGIAEILNRPELGKLVASRDAEEMAGALHTVLSSPLAEAEIARIGREYSWMDTAKAYYQVLQRTVSSHSLAPNNAQEKPPTVLT